MIHCECPHCGTAYDIGDDFVGRKLRCAQCQKAFTGPATPGPGTPFQEASEPPAETRRAASSGARKVYVSPLASTPPPSRRSGRGGTKVLLIAAVVAGLGAATYQYLSAGLPVAARATASPAPDSGPPKPTGPPAERAATYDVALARAKETGKDIVVLQRGSDWNRLGETLYRNVWLTDDFARELGDQFVLVAVDHPEVVGGLAVKGQCSPELCGPTGLSETQIGNAPPLRLAKLTAEKTPLPASQITAVASADGATYRQREDGAWLAEGANPGQDTLTLKVKAAGGGRVLRLDFPTDPSLPGNGPGRASNGNFALTEVEVTIGSTTAKLEAAWASAGDGASGPWQVIDGETVKNDNHWNPQAHLHLRRTLLLTLAQAVPANTEVTVQLLARTQWGQHVPGCLRAAILSDAQLLEDVQAVARAQLEGAKNAKFSWWDTSICPRLALMDSQGRAVACENKPRAELTWKTMADRIKKLREVRIARDALWAKAEAAQGAEKAELLRQGLDVMAFGNWPGNENLYKPIHDQIRAADSNDVSGVQRWLRFSTDPRNGGLDLAPAWKLRDEKKFEEAIALVDQELKDPRNRIFPPEYIQRTMMAKFHIYRSWPGHEEQRFDVQREIAALNPHTYWGVGAIGYLACLGQSATPMLTYGWAARQVKAGTNAWDMTDTVNYFDHAGPYLVKIAQAAGTNVLKIKRLALLDEAVVLAEARPDTNLVAGKSVEGTLDVTTWTGSSNLVLRVEYEAGDGYTNGNGTFSIEPQLLPPPAATAGGAPTPASDVDYVALQEKLGAGLTAEAARDLDHVTANPALRSALAQHEIIRSCTATQLNAVATRPGGAAFLKDFLGNTEWMESFLSSDPANWPQAVDNLRLLHLYGKGLDQPFYQRLATAMALSWGGNPYRLVDRFAHTQRAYQGGLLHIAFDHYTVREMRWAVLLSGSAREYQFLLDDRQCTAGEYLGACWAVAYRDPNDYGDSVQGWLYITPWTHAYGNGQGDRPFIAHRAVGGVCGTLSGYGAVIARAHGIMSTTVGQPGHCAYVVRMGDEWPVGYSVTWPTAVGTPGWEGTGYSTFHRLYEPVCADRERFMNASRLAWVARLQAQGKALGAWTGTYEKAIAAQPTNYGTWLEYIKALEGITNVAPAAWQDLGRRSARTFAICNEAGWALTMRCLGKVLPGLTPDERVALLFDCNVSLRQENWLRPEGYPIDGIFNWQADRIGDPLLAVDFFRKLLSVHHSAKPENNWIFGQLMNWGANRFAGNPATAPAYAKAMAGFFQSQGDAVDKGQISGSIVAGIRKASEAGDLASYRLWSDLAEKMLPPLQPADVHLNPEQVKTYPPLPVFPGVVLSRDGLLQTSSACQFDRPLSYRQALSGSFGGWFDTNGEDKPWAQVQLAGDSDISGIVLVNRYEYAPTQDEFQWASMIKVSVSSDGKTWTPVVGFEKAEVVFSANLQGKATRARYVRIERLPGTDKTKAPGRFHFRNFLVYGKKLY